MPGLHCPQGRPSTGTSGTCCQCLPRCFASGLRTPCGPSICLLASLFEARKQTNAPTDKPTKCERRLPACTLCDATWAEASLHATRAMQPALNVRGASDPCGPLWHATRAMPPVPRMLRVSGQCNPCGPACNPCDAACGPACHLCDAECVQPERSERPLLSASHPAGQPIESSTSGTRTPCAASPTSFSTKKAFAAVRHRHLQAGLYGPCSCPRALSGP
jgi:hypothetical protein